MRKLFGIGIPLALVCVLAACQTSKSVPQAAVPAAPGQSLIETEARGFSPGSENGKTTIDFAVLFADPGSVKSWKVSIANDKGTRKNFTGTGTKLPSNLIWDGKTDSGQIAPQGIYTADLSIDYGAAFAPGTAKSTSFILDTVAPTGEITVFPAFFAPIDPTDTVTISIDAAASLARLDSWSMDIYDPGGNLFKSFDAKWGINKVVWDGKGLNGDLVVSAEDYPVVVKLRDEFGNVGLIKSTIPIDIIVIKQGDGYMIPNSRVYFKGFTADYHDVPADLSKQNLIRLDRLAAELKKFPGYKIKIVGHAVMIHWDSPTLGKIEEDSVLLPLSKARAEAIKQAMADRGLDPATIETEGVGATEQLVPDSDYAQRWQNRRTALFLIK
ncbi:MAG: OmpA family protein [Rectinemataceae bacterium]